MAKVNVTGRVEMQATAMKVAFAPFKIHWTSTWTNFGRATQRALTSLR